MPLVSCEGVDGSGKSQVIRRLEGWFVEKNIKSISFREPGSTTFAEAVIRPALLRKQEYELDAMTEFILFFAARRHLVATRIKPALAKGTYVLMDRYVDSSLAYQGMAVGWKFAVETAKTICGSAWPDLTLFIDVPVEVALPRALGRTKASGSEEARFESKGRLYFENVRSTYLEIAKGSGNRVVVIDGNREPSAVFADVLEVVKARLFPSMSLGLAS
jgi:dTMP kinase